MLKVSKLVLVGALWFGACVQAAEAVPTGDPVVQMVTQSAVPGFTREDIQFVRDAYLRYQETVAGYEKQREESNKKYYLTQYLFNKPELVDYESLTRSALSKVFSKKTEPVDYESLIHSALIDYCNTLLSRFYRSQLVAMAKAAPSNFNLLKEAIRVACQGIDEIGGNFIKLFYGYNYPKNWGYQHIKYQPKIKEQIRQLRDDNILQIALNAVDINGATALIAELSPGNLLKAIVKELLSFKDASGKVLVDVNAADKKDNTALMKASSVGYADIVKELLSLKDASGKVLVDVNAANNVGWTALIWACRGVYGIDVHVGTVKELLEHGANILHNNDDNESALGILHEKLMDVSVSTVDKAKIRSILDVFDALKPNLTPKKLSILGQGALELKNAYVEFQKGKPKRLIFVINSRLMPGIEGSVTYSKGHVKAGKAFLNEDVMSNEIQPRVILDTLAEVFKAESIVPLLEWLVKVISYQPMPQPKMQEVQTRFKHRLERLLDLAKKS